MGQRSREAGEVGTGQDPWPIHIKIKMFATVGAAGFIFALVRAFLGQGIPSSRDILLTTAGSLVLLLFALIINFVDEVLRVKVQERRRNLVEKNQRKRRKRK